MSEFRRKVLLYLILAVGVQGFSVSCLKALVAALGDAIGNARAVPP